MNTDLVKIEHEHPFMCFNSEIESVCTSTELNFTAKKYHAANLLGLLTNCKLF